MLDLKTHRRLHHFRKCISVGLDWPLKCWRRLSGINDFIQNLAAFILLFFYGSRFINFKVLFLLWGWCLHKSNKIFSLIDERRFFDVLVFCRILQRRAGRMCSIHSKVLHRESAGQVLRWKV